MIFYMDLGFLFEYFLLLNNGFIFYIINYIDVFEVYMK